MKLQLQINQTNISNDDDDDDKDIINDDNDLQIFQNKHMLQLYLSELNEEAPYVANIALMEYFLINLLISYYLW